MFYLNLTFSPMSGVPLPSATCHGRGLLLLCFNPTRAGCCCESISARRCKVQRMGLAAHYARLIGASSRTWAGIHLHESRLAETRNQSVVMKGEDCDEKDEFFFFFDCFLKEKISFLPRKKNMNEPGVYEWLLGGAGAHEARFIDESV